MRHQETPSHRRAQAVSTFEKTSTPLSLSLAVEAETISKLINTTASTTTSPLCNK
jgi:hypothetical protein